MRTRHVIIGFLILGLAALVSAFWGTEATANSDLTGQLICIDPGHGGSDPGATNPAFDLEEADINLDVSYGLKSLLEANGAAVVLTRTDDSYKDNEDRYVFCNQAGATLLVSIHTNSVTDPTWDGSMALYFHPDEEDQVLAQAVYEIMYPSLKETAPDSESFDSFGLDWFASGVLLKSDMPGTMLEPVFMSHPGEAALLVQPIYTLPGNEVIETGCLDLGCRRGQIAHAINLGILNYYAGSEPAGVMHVAGIEMDYGAKGRNIFVTADILVQDSAGDPVASAEVSLTLTLPDGAVEVLSTSTGPDGVAAFKLRAVQHGTYQVEVNEISKAGWVYDPTANIQTSASIIVP